MRPLVLAALAAALTVWPVSSAGAATGTPIFAADASDGAFFAAAGHGHVLAVRITSEARSSLLEVRIGERPRFVRSIAGLGRVTVGMDAAGRAVGVATTCRSTCHLIAVDLATGRARTLRGSTRARFGVLARGQLTLVRADPRGRHDLIVRLPRRGGGAPEITDTRRLARADREFDPGRGMVRVEDLAVRGDTVAAVLQYDTVANGGSSVSVRRGTQPWRLLARSGYGEASGIPRVFRGVDVDGRGVRSFYDGGDNDRPYAARWSVDGRLVKRVSLPGVHAEVPLAAFDGDWLYTGPSSAIECDGPDDASCGPQRYGPLRLG